MPKNYVLSEKQVAEIAKLRRSGLSVNEIARVRRLIGNDSLPPQAIQAVEAEKARGYRAVIVNGHRGGMSVDALATVFGVSAEAVEQVLAEESGGEQAEEA